MKNYSDNLYELQREYTKQVNLMLKDDLRTDFEELFNMIEKYFLTTKEKKYSCNDGRLVAWIKKSTAGYKKEILIETQSCLFNVQLKDSHIGQPEIEILYIPYEEDEKKYLRIDKSVRIYHWFDEEDLEFGLTAFNRQEIICYFRAINTFLLNWDSLHCCLKDDLNGSNE